MDMRTIDEIVKILREHRSVLKQKYKIKRIKIFGSYVDLLTEESISPFIKPYIKKFMEI